jgi:hypothetical protein
MSRNHADDRRWQPTPRELADHADGRLDASAAARVETWLAGNPRAAAEVAAERRLHRAWRETQPPEPSAAAWAATLDRVAARIPIRPPAPVGRRRSRLAGWAALAAALLVALTSLFFLSRTPPPPRPHEDPWPVVSADEVEIVSMADPDARALVVGRPPLAGPMLLVSTGELTLINVQPDTDGMRPRKIVAEAGDVPMIVAPLGRQPARAP